MNRFFAWIISHSCYWIGHGLSKIIGIIPKTWHDTHQYLHNYYQKIMRVSYTLCDKFHLNVWESEENDPVPKYYKFLLILLLLPLIFLIMFLWTPNQVTGVVKHLLFLATS